MMLDEYTRKKLHLLFCKERGIFWMGINDSPADFRKRVIFELFSSCLELFSIEQNDTYVSYVRLT